MKRTSIAALTVVTAAWLALFGWGAIAGAKPVMGIVARAGDAAIEASDQPGVTAEVTIDSVSAPEDAFVVVHQSMDGKPGMRLGYARVPAGVTRDVKVRLDSDVELTPDLLAAVHADRGTRGKLEFDMDNMEHSPDRPFFVDGAEVATAFAVK